MKFMKHKEKDFEIWLPIKTYPDFKISNWGRLDCWKILKTLKNNTKHLNFLKK